MSGKRVDPIYTGVLNTGSAGALARIEREARTGFSARNFLLPCTEIVEAWLRHQSRVRRLQL